MTTFTTYTDLRAHVGPLMGSMVTEHEVHAVADVLWAEGIRSEEELDDAYPTDVAWNQLLDYVLA